MNPELFRRCAGCNDVFAGRSNRLYCSDRCQKDNENRRRYQRANHPEKVRGVSGPIQSVIKGSNGMLIEAAARLGYLNGGTVLDTTYGRGLWWTRYRPDWLIQGVSDFRSMPENDDSIDVVCFDPPYISTGSRDTSSVDDFYSRYGLGDLKGWRAIRRLIDDGMAECARVLKPGGYLLIKCMDYVESGHKVWNTFHVAARGEELGLELVDRFHHLTGGGPQVTRNRDGSPRRQQHSREVTSMLLVFTK